eukprot:XP_014050430.1 PREDICTED: lipopolysaccharide-responsive and beige-like anchor protein [Salmo salar]
MRSESYIGGDCYILSGSRDATLLLWYWNGKHRSIGENPGTEFVTPRAILTGHDCEVTCASVCAELGLVISGCREGPCLIHSMNGDLLRTLEGPVGCVQPRLIQSSTEGHAVVYYDKGHFCFFSINGKLLGHMEMEENIRVKEPTDIENIRVKEPTDIENIRVKEPTDIENIRVKEPTDIENIRVKEPTDIEG